MSELTPCNFCNLRWMRASAARHGNVITMRPSKSELGGIEVFEHAENEEITEKHWIAWFMALTDTCCC